MQPLVSLEPGLQPQQQVIRFLLQSGKSHELSFNINDNIGVIRREIFKMLPLNNVSTSSEIRLLYNGRFLVDEDFIGGGGSQYIIENDLVTMHVLEPPPLKASRDEDYKRRRCCIFQ